MSIPSKLYVARSYAGTDKINGSIIDATKDHTKAYQDKKSRVDQRHRHNTLASLELDNVPTKGFSVVKQYSYVSRECFFSIHHPRGFEFSISVQNMIDLIANNNIINGSFVDEMYFDDKLQLINSNTEAFEKMKKREEIKEKNKNTKENLKCGSGFVYLKNEFYYCGKVHAISVHANKDYALTDKSRSYDLVYDIGKKLYSLCNDLSKYQIEQRALLNTKTDLETEVQKANTYFQSTVKKEYAPLSDQREPVLIHTKSFKKSDLRIQYNDISYSEMSNGVNYFCSNLLYLAEYNNNTYRVFFGLNKNYKPGVYRHYSNDYDIINSGNFEIYCAYPCTVSENTLEMDVDINSHYSFAMWGAYKSPFYPPSKRYDAYSTSYKNKKELIHLDPSNTVLKVGRYYLQGK